MGYDIAVEGLQPKDKFSTWFNLYTVITTDWKGGQKVITLEVEDRFGRVSRKLFKTNTKLRVSSGPTYEWRKKIEMRKSGIDFCEHCGQVIK